MASVEETKELAEAPKEGEDSEGGAVGEAEGTKKVSEVKDDDIEVRKPPERKERAAKREKAREKEREKAKKEDKKEEGKKDVEEPKTNDVDVPNAGDEAKTPPVEPAVDDVVGDDVAITAEALPVEGEEGKKVRRRKAASKDGVRRRTKSRDDSRRSGEVALVEAPVPKEEKPDGRLKIWWDVCKDVTYHWRSFLFEEAKQRKKIASQRNRCVGSLMLMILYVGMGALVFRFTEGAFEAFYKCGVKRVKRDFIDGLWSDARSLTEDEWKSRARRRLMELEGQLQAAYEAGVTTYSGRRAWSFLNSVVYCLTVVTTIGYGHIAPATSTGRAITIVYAIFGIPMFLILLADFGKLFTRGIKFLWAFVRRVYYTGSCKKVRRTGPVQEVMKGVQLVYDFATFRRPSQVINDSNVAGGSENQDPKIVTSSSLGATLASPEGSASQSSLGVGTVSVTSVTPDSVRGGKSSLGAGPMHGFPVASDPGTPVVSTFEVDDEFNLPISVAIVILLGYIFIGATIYFSWEEWSFFESFYFVFISMSTIGFGDYVPQHPMYMMASIVYLVFGLALTSMCINVVQEKLSDSFRQASVKLGATIGLQVTEEEEAALAAQKVELAEVHTAGKKQETT